MRLILCPKALLPACRLSLLLLVLPQAVLAAAAAAPQGYAPEYFVGRWAERQAALRRGDVAQGAVLLAQVIEAKQRSFWPNLPTFARALVAESVQMRQQHELGRALVLAQAATQLAPDLADAHVARALAAWGSGDMLGTAQGLQAALVAVWRDVPARQSRLGMLLLSAMVALMGTAVAFSMLQLLRYARPWLHDLNHRLPHPLYGWQATAVAVAVFALPALLRLGPAWTLLWWSGCLSSSMERRERATAAALILALVGVALTLPRVVRSTLVSGTRGEARILALADPAATAAAARLQQLSAPQPLELYALGLRARWSGDLATAERATQRALAAGLAGSEAHVALGNLALARGDVQGAVHAYDAAIRLRPEAPLPRLNRQRVAALAAPGSVPALATVSARLAAEVRSLEVEARRRGVQVLEPPLPAGLLQPDPWPASKVLTAQLWRPWGGALPWPVFVAAAVLALLCLLRPRARVAAFACRRCNAIACARCNGTLADAVLCPGCHALAAYPDVVDANLKLRKEIAAHRYQARQLGLQRLLGLVTAGPAQLLRGAPVVGTLLLYHFLLALVLLGWGSASLPDLAPAYASSMLPLRVAAIALLLTTYLLGTLHLRRMESPYGPAR